MCYVFLLLCMPDHFYWVLALWGFVLFFFFFPVGSWVFVYAFKYSSAMFQDAVKLLGKNHLIFLGFAFKTR